MILAHGPLGYLLAYVSQNRWYTQIQPAQRRWVYLAAFIGGIFPDVDLFYFYLVDSSVSHRQLITHSLITYTVLLIVMVLLLKLRPQQRFWWLAGIVFCVGAYSHIAADMLIGMAALFNPMSQTLYGLVSIPWYRDSWFMRYNLVTNFTAETVIILVALGTYLRKRWLWISTPFITLIAGVILYWLSLHNYKPDGFFYYSDNDQDGLLNAYDQDIDGDQLPNLLDTDIDQDGQDNTLEFYVQLFAAEGSLFDYSYGHLIEVPLRFGLVNPAVLINRLYANVGIFFGEEMTTDYANHPDGYANVPSDNAFSENPANWLAWLEHIDRTVSPSSPLQEYDILFFNSGYVALFMRDETGQDVVLDVHQSHLYSQYKPLAEVSEREGGVLAIGRLLPKPVAKHY
jgi:inner membrane protein